MTIYPSWLEQYMASRRLYYSHGNVLYLHKPHNNKYKKSSSFQKYFFLYVKIICIIFMFLIKEKNSRYLQPLWKVWQLFSRMRWQMYKDCSRESMFPPNVCTLEDKSILIYWLIFLILELWVEEYALRTKINK